MKSTAMKLCLAALITLVSSGCPQKVEAPTCTTNSCANGCCSSDGTCVTAHTASACGLNAAACTACSGATNTCNASGICAAGPSVDGGMTVDAGIKVDAGVDAGNPCVDAPGDAVLGTFALMGGATVSGSTQVPAGIIAVTEVNGVLYGLDFDGWVRRLGTFPTLALGTAVGKVVAPADIDAGVFVSGFLASTGSAVLGGYTGASFSGQVAVIDVADAGVRYVNAPGNYTAVAAADSFVINGTGLAALTGQGVYALHASTLVTAKLATFDASFNVAGSGLTAVTGTGVLLLGYAQSPSFENFVRAVPEALYGSALSNATTIALTPAAPLLAQGYDLSNLDGLGAAAIVVNGGYGANGPFTTAVKRVPVTVSGAGNDVVTVGTATTLLQENGSKCTRVIFTSSTATSYYLGVQDARGRRLIKLTP